MYAEQIASAFAKYGSKKCKRRIPTYALNVIEFIDDSASEGKETSESSDNNDSATESTVN